MTSISQNRQESRVESSSAIMKAVDEVVDQFGAEAVLAMFEYFDEKEAMKTGYHESPCGENT
jgi:hypothetical protein